MPQFDLNYFPSQIFWLIVVFGLMYVVVGNFIAPAAENIFKKRQSLSEENIKKAEFLTNQANKLKTQYENDYNNIWLEAKNLNAEAIKKLNLEYQQRKTILAEQLDNQEKFWSLKITKEIAKFKATEQQTTVSLAKIIIEKVTQNNIDELAITKIYNNITHKA